ncbi:MAG: aminopeptidase N [Nocardioides sp.]|nr:aminopeptidase N [Nocardioides sp.]
MSLTYTEARARAGRISKVTYAIDLDLRSRETFGVRTIVTFDLADPRDTTFLELAGAQDLRLRVNDAPVESPAYDGTRIMLHDLAPSNEVVVEARVPYVNDGDGMHTVTDPADKATYVMAYAGMDLGHRVFACFDQPDLKAPITLTVTAPDDWTVVANGRPVDGREVSGGTWQFTTTPPISTYLFTVCAGPWASRTWEHAGLCFGWHARASLAAELDRDFENLREVTEQCFDFYTSTFDEPYPFDSYDQVMGPGHNWGAMETPGCVTFRDEYLPRHEPDAGELVERAMVIAHEMAHMWFGDLVTMKWWQDTWLNESFADFMGYHVANEIGVRGSWPDFSLNRKPTGFAADGRRSTHPIAEDAEHLVDVDTAFTNFDMITYAKGASVLHQLVTWLGWDTFVKGTNVYLTRHRFGNAELADYLEALDSVTDRDVRGWAEAYLRTTGYDTIRVGRVDAVPVLEREGTRPHRFSVAGLTGSSVTGTRLVDLESESLPLPEFAGAPVIPNAADEAYAAVLLDDLSWDAAVEGLSSLPDPLLRAVTWTNASNRVRSGLAAVGDYLAIVEAHLGAETDPVVFDGVLRRVMNQVLRQWTAPEAYADAQRVVADVCASALTAGDTDRGLAAMRRLAETTTDVALLRRWLDSGEARPGLEVDRDTRWLVVRRLVVLGEAGVDLIEAQAAADLSSSGHQASLTALASRPETAAKEDAWGRIVDPAVSNRDFEALVTGLWTPGQEEYFAPYVDRYLEAGPAIAARGQAFAQEVAFSAPRTPMALDRLQRFRDDLEAAADRTDNTVLRRGWRDMVDDYDIALRVRRAVTVQSGPRDEGAA